MAGLRLLIVDRGGEEPRSIRLRVAMGMKGNPTWSKNSPFSSSKPGSSARRKALVIGRRDCCRAR